MTETLILIPARGGSKSIPRKNIRTLAGHPLIAYSIAAGLAALQQSGEAFSGRVIVSTDDPEIAAISRQYGAETPFLRPAEFSQDNTLDLPVFQHALEWLEQNESYQPQIIVQLRPTSPFRRAWHVSESIQRLAAHPEADAIRTVCVPFQNPFKMWRIAADGFMTPLIQTEHAEPYNMPRQLLPDVYWQTGYVDAAWRRTIIEQNSMTGRRILPLVIDPSEWIDIDSPDDWRRAERLLESGELSFERLGFTL